MIASAPAKIILLGEHAAVYGQPAIAVPISSLRAYADIAPNIPPIRRLQISAADLGTNLPVIYSPNDIGNALSYTARLILDRVGGPPPDVTITIRSDIPIASGLGSGAAVTTALARALCHAAEKSLSQDELNALVYEVERMYHGTPSGIDNTVIVYERPIYFVRGQPIETLSIGAPLTILIGDTGIGSATKVTVGDVRRLIENDPQQYKPIIETIGALAIRAREAIEHGEIALLGTLMTENHALLRRLTVSSPELDRLVDAALDAGALGAKLSGGGRGGNMIALVTPDGASTVEQALFAAGAVRVTQTEVKSEAV